MRTEMPPVVKKCKEIDCMRTEMPPVVKKSIVYIPKMPPVVKKCKEIDCADKLHTLAAGLFFSGIGRPSVGNQWSF